MTSFTDSLSYVVNPILLSKNRLSSTYRSRELDVITELQKKKGRNDYRVNVVGHCDEDEKEEKFGQESEKGFSTSDLRGRLWGLFFVGEIVGDL